MKTMHSALSTTEILQAQRAQLLNRLVQNDCKAVSDAELLEIILTPVCPTAYSLSVRLLEQFTTLNKVMYADEHALRCIDGVDDTIIRVLVAMRFLAQRMVKSEVLNQPVMGSWTALMEYCQLASGHNKVEEFRILYLDHAHQLIADEVMHRGTINHTPVYPREIVKRALEHSAGAVILVHNHPPGDVTPSQADIEITHKIVAALATVNIAVHDHVIVSPVGNASFRGLNLL